MNPVHGGHRTLAPQGVGHVPTRTERLARPNQKRRPQEIASNDYFCFDTWPQQQHERLVSENLSSLKEC